MNKLKLELDELSVQSFETTAGDAGRPGTVRGHRFADAGDHRITEETCSGDVQCACETIEPTCPEQWSCPCNTIAADLA